MKKIVTDKDIESKAVNGVFRVEKNMILTPFARDFSVQKGIRLEYASSRETPSSSASSANDLEAAIREIVEAELGHSEAALESVIAEEVRSQLGGGGASSNAPIDGPIESSVAQAVSSVLNAKHLAEGNTAQAVITVAGENNAGIVAGVSAAIGQMGANIVDISQTVVGEYFTMILVVDIQELERKGTSFSDFRKAIENAAKTAGVAANVMHENILRTMHRVV